MMYADMKKDIKDWLASGTDNIKIRTSSEGEYTVLNMNSFFDQVIEYIFESDFYINLVADIKSLTKQTRVFLNETRHNLTN